MRNSMCSLILLALLVGCSGRKTLNESLAKTLLEERFQTEEGALHPATETSMEYHRDKDPRGGKNSRQGLHRRGNFESDVEDRLG
jgi:hypothetical protein